MNLILPPTIIGCGAAILLFGACQDLPRYAYLSPIPFWPLVVMPSGMLWKNVRAD